MMNDDRTVTIGGRRFPVCAVVCPDVEGHPPETPWDRALGTARAPYGPHSELGESYMIPAENGLLIEVEGHPDKRHITLYARTCELVLQGLHDGPMWLPYQVQLLDGRLEPYDHGDRTTGVFYWRHATDEWTVEHIDRMSRLAFLPPGGPAVQLVDRASVVAP